MTDTWFLLLWIKNSHSHPPESTHRCQSPTDSLSPSFSHLTFPNTRNIFVSNTDNSTTSTTTASNEDTRTRTATRTTTVAAAAAAVAAAKCAERRDALGRDRAPWVGPNRARAPDLARAPSRDRPRDPSRDPDRDPADPGATRRVPFTILWSRTSSRRGKSRWTGTAGRRRPRESADRPRPSTSPRRNLSPRWAVYETRNFVNPLSHGLFFRVANVLSLGGGGSSFKLAQKLGMHI